MHLDGLVAALAAAGVEAHPAGPPPSVEVVDLTHDSGQVAPGWLFCCLRGTRHDGHDFAPAAVRAGAAAVLTERELALEVPQVVVADTRLAIGPAAAAIHGWPSRALTVVGVTGTNGKTTTTWLLRAIFEHAGWPCGLLGTLTGSRTTPEAPDLQRELAGLVAGGRAAVAMEVSSHALALHRTDGTDTAVGVFTNLGRDHLDFHGTAEAYRAAKARLFEAGMCRVGVVNADDEHGRGILATAAVPMVPFSLADARDLDIGPTRSRWRWRGHGAQVPLGGAFNVANALAALTAAVEAGLEAAVAVEGLAAAPAVPGRFEPVDAGQPFAVVVDYAHTPEGLDAVLRAAGQAGRNRVLVVFGCGGDRDPDKRPGMGAVASQLADVVVVTSDNPRSEDPAAIISAVIAGIPEPDRARIVVEPDRRAAIALALAAAGPGDVVVIAGKGHETTQDLGAGRVVPFDDRVVARELLEAGA